jgi:hypothetical protein
MEAIEYISVPIAKPLTAQRQCFGAGIEYIGPHDHFLTHQIKKLRTE